MYFVGIHAYTEINANIYFGTENISLVHIYDKYRLIHTLNSFIIAGLEGPWIVNLYRKYVAILHICPFAICSYLG